MTVEVKPFKAEHINIMDFQIEQKYFQEQVSDEVLLALEKQESYTVFIDGKPILCGGIVSQWENRAIAWVYVDKLAGRHFVRLHKMIKDFLVNSPVRRIEATVDDGFKPGHRWLKLFGFKLEAAHMAAYSPDGRGASLYAYVK